MSKSKTGNSKGSRRLRSMLLGTVLLAVTAMVLPLTGYVWSAAHAADEAKQSTMAAADRAETDSANARASLKAIINAGSGKLIIDLADTTFMDSSGLAVLVSSLQAARKKDGDVYLASMSNTVRALFELTRLHTVFQIFDDEAAALRALS